MYVARVLNPKGPRINVAGNSFIVNKNTREAPANTPPLIKGNVIELITFILPLPKDLAASSILGFTCSREFLIGPTAKGKNSTTYEKTKIIIV